MARPVLWVGVVGATAVECLIVALEVGDISATCNGFVCFFFPYSLFYKGMVLLYLLMEIENVLRKLRLNL